MDLSGKKVSVIGAGKSGIAAAELLCSEGSQVLLSDFGRIEESVVRRLESQKYPLKRKDIRRGFLMRTSVSSVPEFLPLPEW